MSSLFSVVIPVYNVEDYLAECIDSVLSQNFSSYEIILVDDGSTDSSGEICDEYAVKYPQIQVIHQKNGGLSAARNTGIKNAKGDYLVFVDSDDKIYPDSLRHLQLAIADQHNPDFIVSRRCTLKDGELFPCLYHFDKDICSLHKATEIYAALQSYEDCWLGVWIFTVKRSYSEKWNLLFYPGILHEDEEWVPRLFFHTNHIGFNNELLYCNRVERAGSITATPTIKHEFDRLLIIDLLTKEFQRDIYAQDVQMTIKQRMQKIYFGVLCQTELYQNDREYPLLLEKINEHRHLIAKSERTIYQLTYWTMRILGTRATCRILLLLNKLKK